MPKLSEETVAAYVVTYLEAAGADVYQEVEVSGGVADIVARIGAETWIVEVKTSLSWALLAQALNRGRLAHRVYVAAPSSRGFGDFGALCTALGIGLLRVHADDRDSYYRNVREEVASRRWNTRPVGLASDLKPEHKTHARAGAASAAGRWTPFRNTLEQLARLVHDEPGIALKAAIGKLKHHYRTDRGALSSLAKWCADGKVTGVRLARSHGSHGTLVLQLSEAG